MVYFLLKTFLEKDKAGDEGGLIPAPNFEILLMRLLCAVFLHIQL
jgi:hypothetical protein